MSALRPFLRLWLRHPFRLALGVVLAILTLLASIGLLTLSGWFLAASSVAGVAGLYSFNYMLPAAGVRGAASSAPPPAMLNGWSATTRLSGYCSICGCILSVA